MIKYFTIEDLLKHYLQKKFHILIFIVVVLGFFEGNWKRKLFVGSSFFAFIITIEGIVALSIGYFFHIE